MSNLMVFKLCGRVLNQSVRTYSTPSAFGASKFPTTIRSDYQADAQDGTFALSRRFQPGERYHPRDLDEENYPRTREQMKHAPMKAAEFSTLSPMAEYKNTAMLSLYVSEIGKILPRKQTGLTSRNHRLMAKAIRRSRALGDIYFPALLELTKFRLLSHFI